jgi:hypothetical protein
MVALVSEVSFVQNLNHTCQPAITDWVALGICGWGVLLDLVLHQMSISPSKTFPYEYVVPVLQGYMLTPLIICYPQVCGQHILLVCMNWRNVPRCKG